MIPKFRAWYKPWGELKYKVDFRYSRWTTNANKLHLSYMSWENPAKPVAMEADSTILMQFTGLKDINGIEIYEGDIIEGTNIVFGTKILEGQVIMSKGFWATVKRNKRELDKETDEFLTNIGQEEMKNYFFHVNLFAINKPEIIGNVFENPELLKGDLID